MFFPGIGHPAFLSLGLSTSQMQRSLQTRGNKELAHIDQCSSSEGERCSRDISVNLLIVLLDFEVVRDTRHCTG